MRVIHLISGGDVGGAKTHVLTLLKGLSARMNITLVCFLDGPFASEARAMGIDTRIISGNGVFGDLRALEVLIKNGKYNIVHSHGSRGNAFSALLKPRLGLPAVTTIHSDYRLDYLGSPVRAATYGTLNRWALTKMDYYTGVSDPISETLIKRGFPAERMFTIYNGIDFESVSPDRNVSREKLGFSPSDVIVGIAARFDPVKNVGELIAAFAKVADDCPNMKLALAGDGRLCDTLKKQAANHGLSERVIFLGWQEDMRAFYSAIDINALTSRSETFPYALTEGARSGIATVASNVGGIPKLIDHGVNGFLYKSGKADALAVCLKNFYDSTELRTSLGARLNAKARKNFSIKNTVDTQEKIYEDILARSARAKKKRDGITLCGAYGYGNAGDDGILTAILDHMREMDPFMPVRVMSRNPRQTACQFRVETLHTLNPFALTRSLKRSELYVNGGGNLMQDATSSRSLWFYLFTLWLAKKRGAKVLMYACGIGPIDRKRNRRLTAKIMSRYVDAITVREPDALRELENLGVRIEKTLLTADPALRLAPASDEAVDAAMLSMGLEPRGMYIGVALREWSGFTESIAAFASMLDTAYTKYGLTPILLPFEAKRDDAAAKSVAGLLKSPFVFADGLRRPEELIGILSRMRAVVGMRLHALIFAAGQGVPLIGVSYDNKARAFLDYLGQDLCCMLSEASPERLTALLDECMSRPDDPAERLAAVTRLRNMEKGNVQMLREMLG
ncbi:MAG: polysaccharide pyruvyl transferase CsaB [Oscillospiraceae bacterium]|nr:polysaccharide pyruvyl transferase CsaB [Oscillospiraceae bacterium]